MFISKPDSSVRHIPLPDMALKIAEPVHILDSNWTYYPEAAPNQLSFIEHLSDGIPVQIPGHRPNGGDAFKTSFYILDSDEDYHYLLRFESVNGSCDIYVNNQYVCSHRESFVSFDVDVSSFVVHNTCNSLIVFFHPISRLLNPYETEGIIRPVSLITMPRQYICQLDSGTKFDSDYQNATLSVHWKMADSIPVSIHFSLQDPTGNTLFSDSEYCNPNHIYHKSFFVKQPQKWDAEHPVLYTLMCEVYDHDICIERIRHWVGFQSVNISDNQLLINGSPVKLRGVTMTHLSVENRWNPSYEETLRDIELLKQANINFVSFLDSVPTGTFLDLCDKKGLYVQQGLPFTGIGYFGSLSADDPELLPVFEKTAAALIPEICSRPSVILWSLANDSIWGENFHQLASQFRKLDFGRPLTFNRPITIQKPSEMIDIWTSCHNSCEHDPSGKYDNFDEGEYWGDIPVLYQNYAQLPYHNIEERKRDPAVHNFWGESLLRHWDSFYHSPNVIGGCISSAFDLPAHNPEETVEFGIWDCDRRPRPEYWHTYCTYSPVFISNLPRHLANDNILSLELENRYNHTNLRELKLVYTYSNKDYEIPCPDVAPHTIGKLTLQLPDVPTTPLTLHFIEKGGHKCAQYTIPPANNPDQCPALTTVPALLETTDFVIITGIDFQVSISKETGLLSAVRDQMNLIEAGPYLHLDGISLPEWNMEHLCWTFENDCIVFTIMGAYGNLKIEYLLKISANGVLHLQYKLLSIPFNAPATRGMREGINCGGYSEVGICWILPSAISAVYWSLEGLWSNYPPDHIGRLSGSAVRTYESDTKMSESWNNLEVSHSLFGTYDCGLRGTNDFRSMKSNFRTYAPYIQDHGPAVTLYSSGQDAARLAILRNQKNMIQNTDKRIHYSGQWYHRTDAYGCTQNTESICCQSGSYAEITFEGTGIRWVGSKYLTYGTGAVYLDGVCVDPEINLYSGQLPGTARGFERVNNNTLYAIRDLPFGKHVLKIVVTGKKRPESYNSYISIDYLELLDTEDQSPVGLYLLNEWNYPGLSYGNYTKPVICVPNGYHGECLLFLGKGGNI